VSSFESAFGSFSSLYHPSDQQLSQEDLQARRSPTKTFYDTVESKVWTDALDFGVRLIEEV